MYLPGLVFIVQYFLYLLQGHWFRFRHPVKVTNGFVPYKKKQHTKPGIRFNRKPDWRLRAVLQHKTIRQEVSYRTIAHEFNRRSLHTRGISISKSDVGRAIRNHCYEI